MGRGFRVQCLHNHAAIHMIIRYDSLSYRIFLKCRRPLLQLHTLTKYEDINSNNNNNNTSVPCFLCRFLLCIASYVVPCTKNMLIHVYVVPMLQVNMIREYHLLAFFRSLLPTWYQLCKKMYIYYYILILRRMGKNKAWALTIPRIRYVSCFDLTHAPVATVSRVSATGLVSMLTRPNNVPRT